MAEWRRAAMTVVADMEGAAMPVMIPTITLRTFERPGRLRVGLWFGDTRLGGWVLPSLPPHVIFSIRDGRPQAIVNGERRDVGGQLLDWDGLRPPIDRPRVPEGTYRVTLDQEPDKVVAVSVDVSFTAVGVV